MFANVSVSICDVSSASRGPRSDPVHSGLQALLTTPGLRLAATELDDAVIRILLDTFANPAKLLELFGTADMPAEQIRKLLGRAKRLAAMLNGSPGKRAVVVRDLVEKVVIAEDEMSVRIYRGPLLAGDARSPASETPTDAAIELTAAVEFKRRGAENRLVVPGLTSRNRSTKHDPKSCS